MKFMILSLCLILGHVLFVMCIERYLFSRLRELDIILEDKESNLNLFLQLNIVTRAIKNFPLNLQIQGMPSGLFPPEFLLKTTGLFWTSNGNIQVVGDLFKIRTTISANFPGLSMSDKIKLPSFELEGACEGFGNLSVFHVVLSIESLIIKESSKLASSGTCLIKFSHPDFVSAYCNLLSSQIGLFAKGGIIDAKVVLGKDLCAPRYCHSFTERRIFRMVGHWENPEIFAS